MTIYLITINIISFIIYGIDKLKAIKRKERIPERTLFLWSIIGGCLGSLIGMLTFHHKTKKLYFYIINILCLIIWSFIIWKVVIT